ncbi:unnamed protein product [Miscanthus lutarioriparius]|uniref:DUF1664 domain-containing protein n=1 Tax=Miscanthus lutarioriparius TaxID=422564 RepID=A0A811QJA7_9POAL|nr:unnamed protein product [Miscanthus lutarioriparius]
MAMLGGTSPVQGSAPQADDGAMWFRPATAARTTVGGVGLDMVLWERMRWEVERGGRKDNYPCKSYIHISWCICLNISISISTFTFRFKGISFSSLMYVTKRNMANAVASMTKHLEQVQSSLAVTIFFLECVGQLWLIVLRKNKAAKKHLSQRIQHVDDKLEQQKEISVQIRDQATGAKLKIKNIGSDMDNKKNMVIGLDEKMDSIEAKQNYSCVAVDYLCQFIEKRVDKLPEQLEGLQQTVKRIGYKTSELPPGLGGFGQLLSTESANPLGAFQIF